MVQLESMRVLQARREDLRAQIGRIGEFRPGSIHETWRKCGKANCACAQPGHPGHGPRVVVTRHVPGAGVRTDSVRPERLAEVSAQVGEYQRFKELVAELTEVSDQIVHRKDAQARSGPSRRAGPTKKGGPKPVRAGRSSTS